MRAETDALTPELRATEPLWLEALWTPTAARATRDAGGAGASSAREAGGPRRLLLEAGTRFVGSAPDCDLVLEDPAVSRRHLAVELLDGAARVRDLGSRNGTRYLGARVSEAVVPPGGIVSLGHSALVLRPASDGVDALPGASELHGLVGRSPAMRSLFARLERWAATDAPVLFVGETGSGKEAAARALHATSRRAREPFVVVDCAAAGPELFESQLFGHVRGAFTGASSDRRGLVAEAADGTLYLDDVAALPPPLQTRLLRLVEARDYLPVGATRRVEARCRICASAREDLLALACRGAFREDLAFRLAVAVIALPPLRERREDIPLLVARFARERAGFDVPLGSATLDLLLAETWRGNVRELRNAVDRALALGAWRAAAPAVVAPERSFHEARGHVLDAFEREYLHEVLRRSGGNVAAAARAAGLARSAFYRLLERHPVARDDADDADGADDARRAEPRSVVQSR